MSLNKDTAIIILCLLFFSSVLSAQEEATFGVTIRRNPFIPLVTPSGRLLKLEKEETVKGEVVVEGIIYDKQGSSYAIVNGAVVEVGDSIGDFQVLKIEENKVIFFKGGLTVEVGLKKEAK